MKKIEKNSNLRSFFGLVPQPEGELRGQAPYPEVLKSLGYRGGPKMAKKCQNCHKMKKKRVDMKRILKQDLLLG